MSSAILRHAVTCLSVRFSYKQQNDNWKEGTVNGFTTYHNTFFLTAGTHRWSDGASTTKHSFVSQRLLDGRWPPAVSCKKLPTANCSLLGVWCLWLIVRPTPPPHPFRYDFLLLPWLLFFWLFSKVQRFDTKVEKQSLIVLTQLKILLAWSADHVSWKQTLTHTHTHTCLTYQSIRNKKSRYFKDFDDSRPFLCLSSPSEKKESATVLFLGPTFLLNRRCPGMSSCTTSYTWTLFHPNSLQWYLEHLMCFIHDIRGICNFKRAWKT